MIHHIVFYALFCMNYTILEIFQILMTDLLKRCNPISQGKGNIDLAREVIWHRFWWNLMFTLSCWNHCYLSVRTLTAGIQLFTNLPTRSGFFSPAPFTTYEGKMLRTACIGRCQWISEYLVGRSKYLLLLHMSGDVKRERGPDQSRYNRSSSSFGGMNTFEYYQYDSGYWKGIT